MPKRKKKLTQAEREAKKADEKASLERRKRAALLKRLADMLPVDPPPSQQPEGAYCNPPNDCCPHA